MLTNKEIKDKITLINFSRMKFASFIMLGFSVYILSTDFIFNQVWNKEYLAFYKTLDIALAIISVFSLLIFTFFKPKNKKTLSFITYLVPFLVLIWAALITGLESSTLGYTTFIFILILCSNYIYLNFGASIIYFIGAFAALTATTFYFNEPGEFILTFFIMIIPVVIISILLSRKNYLYKTNDLEREEKLEELNKKLNESKLDLEEKVKEQTKDILKVKEEVEDKDASFRTIFNLSIDLICIADLKTLRFKTVNPAFKDVLGYEDYELINKPFTDFIHPEDLEETIFLFENKLQKGEMVIDFINRYKCKNGNYKWLKWSSHPVSSAKRNLYNCT